LGKRAGGLGRNLAVDIGRMGLVLRDVCSHAQRDNTSKGDLKSTH
jgi:hypothetical protein